ncbi:YraN family protein [Lactonifactor longoviformis]|uniref:UPF0102 protein SAMN02745158_02883 n=1 Tax=Lactonifactor longoviformis DSM 17459 TaxID=1122155 RepID=A0A1M4ZRL8_9CLOT|nr:YraN family protein [Lactonifactor longoviformis]POP31654.1 YraN family protein [Lactonifactor longoviformis]SHF20689.1 putative endonuclease [Lactonifactor longoviformis DSM 17459]
MRENTRKTGTQYEELAARYLAEQGYRILTKNYRCALGEIDIIARDGRYLCFVEVKYRTSVRQGGPLLAVNSSKQRRICRTASYYLTGRGLGEFVPCRFDVVGITPAEIFLIKDAFPFHI